MLLLSYARSFATWGTAVHQAPLSCALSRVCSNSRPSSQWCCLTISSLLPLSFCLPSFPGSGLFQWVGFLCGSVVKNSPSSAGDAGSVPGSGRSPGEGNGYPLQYSRLGNPMDRGAWWARVHGIAKSSTRLSDFTSSYIVQNDKGRISLQTRVKSNMKSYSDVWDFITTSDLFQSKSPDTQDRAT